MVRPVNGDATDTCHADPGQCWDCRGEPVCLYRTTTAPQGDLTMTSIFEGGELVGVRVERADLAVSIGVDLSAGPLAPGFTFDGTTLRIEATNGTWTYLVHEGGLATLIEEPAVTP